METLIINSIGDSFRHSAINAVTASDMIGYKMIKSLEVSRFRAFRHLKLESLQKINILVGRSAAGKTAFLEAIKLGLGASPQVAFNLNVGRGIPFHIIANPTKEQFEIIWKPYFFDFDTKEKIDIKVFDSNNNMASASIFFDETRPVTPVPQMPNPGMPAYTNTIIPLAFKRVAFGGEESVLDATVDPQQWGNLLLQQGPELGQVCEFFPSTWQANSSQVANWYSSLRIAKDDGAILDAVKKQFSEINDLTVENPSGIPAIYANIKYRSQLLPISLISSGITKFISLLIAIRTYKNGVILIDEIENGIYFQMFPALWKALYEAAIENNTQLFISSHSFECLRASSDVITKHPNDFSVLQIYQEKGESNVFQIKGDAAAKAIKSNLEIRVG